MDWAGVVGADLVCSTGEEGSVGANAALATRGKYLKKLSTALSYSDIGCWEPELQRSGELPPACLFLQYSMSILMRSMVSWLEESTPSLTGLLPHDVLVRHKGLARDFFQAVRMGTIKRL